MLENPTKRAQDELRQAAAIVKAGGVVLHATEGVWGFACDPFNAEAVAAVLAIKGRQADKGFIVIGAQARCFSAQLQGLSESQRLAIQATWPGAHTWILPDTIYPDIIRGGRTTLACRVPGHEQARELCELLGTTLVSTSANRSGEPSLTTQAQAEAAFGRQVGFVLPGAVLSPGKASTIHALDGTILR
jgi:L-threonylcarbamoyladenylate synthase